MSANEPQSWSEAIKQYENEKRRAQPPPPENFPRYSRTKFCPLGAFERNDYSHPTTTHPVGPAELGKYQRRGLGSVGPNPYVINTVTQRWTTEELEAKQVAQDAAELDCEGRMQVPGCAPGIGSNRPMPIGRDNMVGRADLFNHLSYAPAGLEHDTWIGHQAIKPLEGKKGNYPPPIASKGRNGLFDIIGQSDPKPGEINQDAWIGNIQIYPEEGKKSTDPPNVKTGRKDLYDTIQQTGKRAEGDTDQDAWVGHFKINPIEGKSGGSCNAAEMSNDLQGVLRHDNPYDPMEPIGTLVQSGGRARGMKIWPPGHKDFNNFKNVIEMKPPDPSELPLYENQARAKGRQFEPKQADKSGRKDLFKLIQNDPTVVSDEPFTSKSMVRPIPGSRKLHGGSEMLHWKE
eukprot:6742156-Pyramimonas_sp.AAC.1